MRPFICTRVQRVRIEDGYGRLPLVMRPGPNLRKKKIKNLREFLQISWFCCEIMDETVKEDDLEILHVAVEWSISKISPMFTNICPSAILCLKKTNKQPSNAYSRWCHWIEEIWHQQTSGASEYRKSSWTWIASQTLNQYIPFTFSDLLGSTLENNELYSPCFFKISFLLPHQFSSFDV